MKPLNRLQIIVILVLSSHLILILYAGLAPFPKYQKKEAILVRSVIHKSYLPTDKITHHQISQTTPTQPKKKNEPLLKKEAKPKPAAIKKPIKSQEIKNQPTKCHKTADTLTIPELKTTPHQDAPKNSAQQIESISFQEVLSFLESIIVLPAKGSIKVLLKINISGTIENIEILESQEVENTSYLIETLKNYRIPLDAELPLHQEIIVTFRGL